ncbi:MAG: hypothetical protein C4541_05960 [Candidatus Auribacter fodinae]|jgi:hypothetical protein|uniref:Lipoprotein n=1 Tax=Candidatus Auribacter fodinae TaxID=2093366 RepID=A0A3A4RAZ8_9BACT|nr:MAG: hypothetical protein C4541_05960 [Candidatus Auribacter fodinae]
MKYGFIFLISIMIGLCGCASQQHTKAEYGKFRIVKVNRSLRTMTLRGEGFEIIAQKHPQDSKVIVNDLPYNDRGEEFVVIWSYDGPSLANAPVTMHFDYHYDNKPDVYRVTEQYSTLIPGRKVFRLLNTGDDYYLKGEIQNWRVSIFYDGRKVAEKKSSFFGKL